MKNSLLMLCVVVAALFTFACNNEKKKLISQIKTDVSTFEPAVDTITAGHVQVGQLVNTMQKADNDLKRTEEYAELYDHAQGMRLKYAGQMNLYLEKIDSLKALSAQCAAGQVADSVAQQKYAMFSQNLGDFKATFDKIQMLQTENTGKFTQLQEKFAADPSAFHIMPQTAPAPTTSPALQPQERGAMPASTNSPSLNPSLTAPPKKQ